MNSCSRQSFTMVELLVVAAVIAILAGILIPTISSAATKGRETKARADMNSIALAIAQYETDNGILPLLYSSGAPDTDSTHYYIKVPFDQKSSTANYDFIMSVLMNCDKDGATVVTAGKRYLNPPAKPVTDAANNTGYYFLDPWGHRYNIALNAKYNGKLECPATFIASGAETILGKVAIYSYGSAEKDDADCIDDYLFSWKNSADE